MITNFCFNQSLDQSFISDSIYHQFEDTCSIYIADSKIPNAGRGIFAGKAFKKNETVAVSPTFFIKYIQIYESVLQDYIFASYHDDFGLIMLGMGSLFNHNDNNSVEHFSIGEEPSNPSTQITSLTAQTACSLEATRDIAKDEELYLNYGPDWFANRTLPETESAPIPSYVNLRKPQGKKICMSDLDIRDTTRYAANHGIFTKKSYRPGDLITISPALILPFSVVNDSRNSSLLMNYCYYKPGSTYALLPLSYPALINHYKSLYFSSLIIEDQSSSLKLLQDTAKPNVELRWFNWEVFQRCTVDCEEDTKINTLDPSSIPTDDNWKGYTSLTIGYYASENINTGDELLLDYGRGWEKQYQRYLDEIDFSDPHIEDSILFRHWIEVEDGFFPQKWFQDDKNWR